MTIDDFDEMDEEDDWEDLPYNLNIKRPQRERDVHKIEKRVIRKDQLIYDKNAKNRIGLLRSSYSPPQLSYNGKMMTVKEFRAWQKRKRLKRDADIDVEIHLIEEEEVEGSGWLPEMEEEK